MRAWAWVFCLSPLMFGCGASVTASEHGTSAEGRPAGASERSPTERPSRHAALARLRPPGADEALAQIEGGGRDARMYAHAASFYANTDAPGMALIYGLTCFAVLPNCSSDGQTTAAMTDVLRERIAVRTEGTRRDVSTRLAPGSIPAIQRTDGSLWAPVAHLFELEFAIALADFDGTWTLDMVMRTLRLYVSLAEQEAAPVNAHLELSAWLVGLAAAGHLDAFVATSFGSSFGSELANWESTHPNARTTARAWIAAHPYRPSQGPMPDDLVRFR